MRVTTRSVGYMATIGMRANSDKARLVRVGSSYHVREAAHCVGGMRPEGTGSDTTTRQDRRSARIYYLKLGQVANCKKHPRQQVTFTRWWPLPTGPRRRSGRTAVSDAAGLAACAGRETGAWERGSADTETIRSARHSFAMVVRLLTKAKIVGAAIAKPEAFQNCERNCALTSCAATSAGPSCALEFARGLNYGGFGVTLGGLRLQPHLSDT